MAPAILSSAWSQLRQRLRSRSGKGLIAAAIWQLANYAIPLLTFPYLARVLGIEGFGLIGLAGAIMGYANLIVDWGFGLSGTRDVARHKDDPAELRRIVWSIVLAKTTLAAICLTFIVIGSNFVSASLRPVLLAATLYVVVLPFNLEWVLRGVERLGKFAKGSIIGRLASVPLVYLLVREPDDVAVAVIAGGMGGVFVAIIYGMELHKLGLLGRPTIDFRQAWLSFKEGFHLFLSTLAISLYTNTIMVVLGIMSNPAQVGLYAAATRIQTPVRGLLSPISMVFFPRMSALGLSDPVQASHLARRLLLGQGAFALLLTLALTLTAPLLVTVLLGPGFEDAVPVLRVLAWLILLIGVSNVTGVMLMIPFDMKRQFTWCLVLGAIVGTVIVFPLTHFYGALGAAFAALASECVVTASMLLIVRRRFSWMRFRQKPDVPSGTA